MVLRDQVWHIVILTKVIRGESLKRRELGFDESERHTVQRVLRQMEEWGYLHRESKTGGTWYPGVLTKFLFTDQKLSIEERQHLKQKLDPAAEHLEISTQQLIEELEQAQSHSS